MKMATPIAIGNPKQEEIDAELQKGVGSLKNDRSYSADEVDAMHIADSDEVAEISKKLLTRNNSVYNALANFK